MKNILKKEQGITLIALVTAIIILLILSGITIGMLSSENGLINQSYQSSQDAQKESIIEKIEADLYSKKTITGKTPDKDKLIEIAGKYGNVVEAENYISIIDEGQEVYKIYFAEISGWKE